MSGWLKNVGNFLEQLDDKAETVAAEHPALGGNDEEEDEGDIHDILAKRGLGIATPDENEEDDGQQQVVEGDEQMAAAAAIVDTNAWDDSRLNFDDSILPDNNNDTRDAATADASVESPKNETAAIVTENESESTPPEDSSKTEEEMLKTTPPGPSDGSQVGAEAKIETEVEPAPKSEEVGGFPTEKLTAAASDKNYVQQTVEPKEEAIKNKESAETPLPSTPTKSKTREALNPPKPSPRKVPPPSPPPSKASSIASTKSVKAATAEAKEAQKEARTLRRHVVSLNTQLEAAESELKAQRKELEEAAERMEKDRKKQKDEKEKKQKIHAEEVSKLKTQHQQLLREQQMKFEEEIASYKANLAQVEDRRKQEGGNMNKELAELEEREHEMMTKVTMLEDEKSTLLSQISTLQGQQSALGSRLESLTQAADNAMAREREAEDRLDSVLTQHARQISQRQAREAELEKTVSDLNAALVGAKSSSSPVKRVTDSKGSSNDTSLLAKIEALEQDLETSNSNLTLERERSGALHQQLREMSRETTQEASAVHAKEVHFERQIADMSLTISKLEASLRESQNGTSHDYKRSDSDQVSADDSNAEQVTILSEEVIRLRDKLASFNSESKAMKNRLQSAIDRANKAEDEITMLRMNGNNNDYNSMELGGSSNGLDRRRRRNANQTSTIRSVMHLDSSDGGRREQLGNVVDVVDTFAVTTGKYMKRNPLARAGFIFYLLLIHVWTFVLLFFHAHNFEEHSDFGAISPPGPHALVQQSAQAGLVAKAANAGSQP